MTRVLIVRPQPGADRTAARARRRGLAPVTAPIFTVVPVPWKPPAAAEAVLLTSAHAARLGGPGLAGLTRLPCYAVGPATAAAARAVGFTAVRGGPADGAALLRLAAGEGVRSALHLCGRDHGRLGHPDLSIDRRIVYASDAVAALPAAAADCLRGGALGLVHSPRSAAHLAALVDAAGLDRGALVLAAISEAAAAAAGAGWKDVHAAAEPRDEALLELAAKLCQTAAGATERGDTHGL